MQLSGLLIAAVSGLAAAQAGAEPTRHLVIDVVLVVVCVAGTAWIAGRAPWWATAGAAFVGTMIALDPVVVLVGAVVCLAGLARGHWRRTDEWSSVLIAGAALNVLIRSELGIVVGLSALLSTGVVLVLVVTGLRVRSRRQRRIVAGGFAVIGGATLVAVAGVLVAATGARGDVRNGSRLSRDAVRAVNAGDYERASELFAESVVRLDAAHGRLDGPLGWPGRAVPLVAQHLGVGVELTGAVSEAAGSSSLALELIDPSALGMINGAFDLAALRDAEAPLLDVRRALESVRFALDEAESSWLVGPVRRELAELRLEYGENEEQLDTALDAIRLAPALLGGNGERRYLALFTTPAEARGLGGFVGNYTELIFDEGRLSFTEFARRSELEAVVEAHGASCAACPAEFVDQYGVFGFDSGPAGGVAGRAWSNITMSPHFPHVAETAASLFAQSGGGDVDGVIVLDPFVLQALMKYTGDLELPGGGETVRAEDAANFILREQYAIADTATNIDRIDTLSDLGQAVIGALLEDGLPSPVDLASDLSPLVAERRLLMWTDDFEEQRLFFEIGLIGALPERRDGAGFAVTVNNAAGNKIDVFLEREVTSEVVVEPDGDRQLVVDVRLVNGAPATGLHRYVIGNVVGLPDGYSRSLVTFYGPNTPILATASGRDVALEAGTEAGWVTSRHFVELGPGQSISYHLEFALGQPDALDEAGTDDMDVVGWEQPLSTRTGGG